MSANFYTKWIRPIKEKENGFPPSIVDTSFVPPAIQFQEMLAAGERYAANKRQRYDDLYGIKELDESMPLKMGADPTEIQDRVDFIEDVKAREVRKAKEAADDESRKTEEAGPASSDDEKLAVSPGGSGPENLRDGAE